MWGQTYRRALGWATHRRLLVECSFYVAFAAANAAFAIHAAVADTSIMSVMLNSAAAGFSVALLYARILHNSFEGAASRYYREAMELFTEANDMFGEAADARNRARAEITRAIGLRMNAAQDAKRAADMLASAARQTDQNS